MKESFLTDADLSLWDSLKEKVCPLTTRGRKNLFFKPLPSRLRVRASTRTTLINVLDLHGMTIEEAYQVFHQFLVTHQEYGSRIVKVITGRGLHGESKIKKEMPYWLQNPKYATGIRRVVWTSDGGALTIELKRKKK